MPTETMTHSQTQAPPVIGLERVTRAYHTGGGGFAGGHTMVTSLDEVDLEIHAGEIFGLVGESGSGKTTAARLMVRLEHPNHGRVLYHGENVARLRGKKLKRFRRRVQMIFQDPYQSLNPYQSVQHIVEEPLAIHRLGLPAQRQDKVIETLTQVGLTPSQTYLHRYPHQLSGGQRQRVAIARALVLSPDVLIADEPTSMLDASIAIQIYGILSEVQRRRQVTMLFITHSLAAAHFLCDRIAVIYRGHIVEIGPAKSVIADPRHPYTQALLDALPRFGHPWGERRFNTLKEIPRSEPATGGCPFFSRCAPANLDLCRHQRPALKSRDGIHSSACFLVE